MDYLFPKAAQIILIKGKKTVQCVSVLLIYTSDGDM
jgi:hypothetical protein